MKKHQNSICLATNVAAVLACTLLSFVYSSHALSQSIQPQNKPVVKEKTNPITQERINPVPQQKISPAPQEKINTSPKQQLPGTSVPKPPPAGLPDLQVSRVFLSKPWQNTPLTASPLIGDKVDLCCEYANIGKDMPGSSWSLLWKYAVHVDGATIATYDAGAMTAGESHITCIPYTLNKDGLHQLDCALDTTNKITETNENNNKKIASFNVAVTDSPMPAGPGVNLRVTDLSINNDDGRVVATVQNFGPSSMAFDAKIRLRRDNVLVEECLWPKTVSKMVCAANMLARNVPGADPNICNWGKGDYGIRAEIIPELAEPQVDKSGRTKEGILHARQDLFAAYFYEDAVTNKIGIVVGNKGSCYATPWSFRFYVDGNLIETSPFFGGLMKRNEYSHQLLQNQSVFTQSAKRNSLFKFEVVPQFPEFEQSTGNNTYQVKGLSAASGIDIAVTDIIFIGQYYQETYPNSSYTPEGDYYFKILPYIKNVGTVKFPDGAILKTQFFVDNVSVMERDCHPGLAPGAEIPVSNCFASDSNLPTLPAGSHTVRFVVTILDGNIYNNHLVKTMVRP